MWMDADNGGTPEDVRRGQADWRLDQQQRRAEAQRRRHVAHNLAPAPHWFDMMPHTSEE
jgi:hypothetical protein